MSGDKQIIETLGGPAKVCELLGYAKHGGVQRVQNWTVRGIPAKVKLDNPHLFPNHASNNPLPPAE
jgi:hypothetical protein